MEIKIISEEQLTRLDDTRIRKINLAGLILYNKSSSECKSIISRRMASASLFAFDTGQVLVNKPNRMM